MFEQLLLSFGKISVTDGIMVSLKIVNNTTKHEPTKISFQLSIFQLCIPKSTISSQSVCVCMCVSWGGGGSMLPNSTTEPTKKKKKHISPHPLYLLLKSFLSLGKASLSPTKPQKLVLGWRKKTKL
jgi:hypothetical protein